MESKKLVFTNKTVFRNHTLLTTFWKLQWLNLVIYQQIAWCIKDCFLRLKNLQIFFILFKNKNILQCRTQECSWLSQKGGKTGRIWKIFKCWYFLTNERKNFSCKNFSWPSCISQKCSNCARASNKKSVSRNSCFILPLPHKNIAALEQGWANSGPRAKCGPPQCFQRPAEAFGKIFKSKISSNFS